MTALERLHPSKIAEGVRLRKTSALAVIEDVIERLDAYDQVQTTIWISRAAPEALLQAAKAVDARVAAGEALPLAGVGQ